MLLPLLDFGADARQIDVDDIAQFFLRVVRDPNHAGVAFDATHSCCLV